MVWGKVSGAARTVKRELDVRPGSVQPKPMAAAAPIIVSALFGKADFQWFDAQRRAHFPPERNILPAHLTLFHHLPPSIEPELLQRLREACGAAAPAARAKRLISLGGGVAYAIESPALAQIREDLADTFSPLLVPQDAAGWRPHVTIQNKVAPQEAKALLEAIEAGFRPRGVEIAGLAAYYYRGGPWEPIDAYRFSGGQRMLTPKSPLL